MSEEERDEDEKEFLLKLYNGEIDFDDKPDDDEEMSESEESDDDDDANMTNVERLLSMFENTGRELIEQYEQENSLSQRSEQGSQTEETSRNIVRINPQKT